MIGIWFGSNAKSLTLVSNGISLITGQCINGIYQEDGTISIFSQVAACNAILFFEIANKLILKGLLQIPINKIGKNNKLCYTTRSFEVVDQDQSDNVVSNYIVSGNQLAQYSESNLNIINKKTNCTTVLSNGSDNRLLDKFILPALGCDSFTVIDIVTGVPRSAQALNELYASINQQFPVAVIPAKDPMVLVNNEYNINKLNAYRLIVNQPLVNNIYDANVINYCNNLLNYALPSLIDDSLFTSNFNSPDINIADTLLTFLGNRLYNTLNNLNCAGVLDIMNPITPILTNNIVTNLVIVL